MNTRKSDLSPSRARLVELMQRLDFGRIESLTIREGDPVLDPPPRIVRDVKFCSQNGPRPESELHDFVLKAQVWDLFVHFDSIGNGTIRSLEIMHGLPFLMQVEEEPA